MTRYDCVQEWVVECPWTCSWWNKQQTSLCSSSIPEMAEYATKSLMKCNLSYKSNMNLKHSYLYVSYKIIKSCNTLTSGILTWGLHWMQRLLLTISLPATLPSDPRQQTQETSVISHTETSHMPAKKNCQLWIAHSIQKKCAGQIGAKRHWPKNSSFGKRVCENSLILCKSINVAVRWYLRAKQPTSRRIVEMRETPQYTTATIISRPPLEIFKEFWPSGKPRATTSSPISATWFDLCEKDLNTQHLPISLLSDCGCTERNQNTWWKKAVGIEEHVRQVTRWAAVLGDSLSGGSPWSPVRGQWASKYEYTDPFHASQHGLIGSPSGCSRMNFITLWYYMILWLLFLSVWQVQGWWKEYERINVTCQAWLCLVQFL